MLTPQEITVATILTSAVVALWRRVTSHSDKCEKQHEESRKTVLNLSSEVGELKGQISIAKDLSPKIDNLTKAVEAHIQIK